MGVLSVDTEKYLLVLKYIHLTAASDPMYVCTGFITQFITQNIHIEI